ncbi:glycoside hydrolase/deacetylase [Tilletiopsis washingtonensis]|jgi:peptidoglycan/xylan/chitin deacetylase (PgdA/CDA1 family)|uniref:Glycoside hydrolase/deacetylase n=1 Tax=Tilletiopsis washingtonensis TaxID=58919 RepID=A0A316ZHF6_9BASI|nr:glycoside hydrolase/deacetylase [Tilletiopsis washingtonensis]PWO00697.1 glycoside hydrolase/deacetylase [Tilletiopsis washingtonensis]
MAAAPSLDHAVRDLVGYGAAPPHARWPHGARLALSFVVNYEEGAEHTLLNGDAGPERFLTEGGATAAASSGMRSLGVESGYAYGAQRGFWRILHLFHTHAVPFTSWAVGRAVELNPHVVPAMEAARGEVACHSQRWIDYAAMPEAEERQHVAQALDALAAASPSGRVPRGWYTGRQSLQTRRIVYEEYRRRGLLATLYDSDAYDEDLPYWVPCPSPEPGPPLLVVPYTLDCNDMKFAQAPGFVTAGQMYEYLVDAFDTLYAEGEEGSPKMMTVGLHCRVIGRPGRFPALRRFVEYVKQKEQVWIATREEIAEHWRREHPPKEGQWHEV